MERYCPNCQSVLMAPLPTACGCGARQPGGGWPSDPLLGISIEAGRYSLKRRLGVGGFAVVYEALDLATSEARAIKVLDAALSEDPELRARFGAEAKAMRGLVHPNIVVCHDVGLIEGVRPFMVLDLVRGHSLQHEVSGGPHPPRRLSVGRAVSMARQIAAALATAHAANLLHRDLNPNNVMLLDAGSEGSWVRIIDFGMAKILGKNTIDKVTRHIAGTPDFMAPEQFLPGKPLDARLDLWQLGSVLFFALTGAHPYPKQATLRDVLLSIHELLSSAPESLGPRPSTLDTDLATNGDLDDLIAQLLAPHPDARPSSAAEVAARLEAIALLGDGASRQTIKLDQVRLITEMQRSSQWYCPVCQTPAGGERIEICGVCGEPAPTAGWPQDRLVGASLAGTRLKILRRLATSGLGDTYVVHDGSASEQRSLALFNRYGAVTALRDLVAGPMSSLVEVTHSNLLRCHELGFLDDLDVPYMLSAVPQGRTVAELLWPYGAHFPQLVDPAHVAAFGSQVAMALAALHQAGRIHGLLDPSTVVIGDGPGGRQAVVTSYGFAELLQAVSTTHTLESSVGRAEYMPAEHFNSETPLSPRADLYQLGALLFFMLTGWPPFTGDSLDPRLRSTPYVIFQKQMQIGDGDGPRPSIHIPALRAFSRLDQLVSALLATDADRRPGSALAVAERLNDLAQY